MKVTTTPTAALPVGNAGQRAQLRGWLSRLAWAGVLLAACAWGWAGYQGGGAQAAIVGLWSLCGAS